MDRKVYRRIRIAVAVGVFSLTAFCFIAGNERMARLLSLQPGPVLVRLVTNFTLSGLFLTAGFFATAFLFGRYFCAALCPLGAVQDAVGSFRRQRKKNAPNIPNAKAVRYGIVVLSFLFLAGGWTIGFKLFDPFSRFGGILSATSGGLLSLAILVGLVLWKRRVYCTAVCPVGTLLGLCAKWGVYRLRVEAACTGCGICEHHCPTGCIDSRRRTVDNERCVRCLNCISFCPRGSIGFSRQTGRAVSADTAAESSRRAFLIKSASVALGVFAASIPLGGTLRALARPHTDTDNPVLPPGAGDAGRFARKCTSCQLCALNCPADIIKPAHGFGPVRLDFTRSGCRYDCALCSAVCPYGALQYMTLEDKQWLRLGEAVWDAPLCRAVKDNIPCDLCAQACPKGAIFMQDSPAGLKVPEVAAFHCIGCGNCEAVCPVRPKAIRVRGSEQQL